MSILKNLTIATAVLPAVAVAIAEPGLAATLDVFEPDATVLGRTQAEWSAKWWQYVTSIPSEQNPILDETGTNADIGQSDPVYFLTGSFSTDPVKRKITVPNNKPIFFPLINSANIATEPDETADQLREVTTAQTDAVDTLFAKLDGVDVPNLFDYRQQAPVFSITLPDDNIFGLPVATYKPAVSDGYWLMLAPLPKGNHKLSFGGANEDFSQDIRYNITSVPEPSSVLGTLIAGTFGVGWMLKRKLKLQTKTKILG